MRGINCDRCCGRLYNVADICATCAGELQPAHALAAACGSEAASLPEWVRMARVHHACVNGSANPDCPTGLHTRVPLLAMGAMLARKRQALVTSVAR
jgi:hypothetical protein